MVLVAAFGLGAFDEIEPKNILFGKETVKFLLASSATSILSQHR